MIVEETRIGKIRSVNGAKIYVSMEPESEIAPVINGRIHHVTQLGSILKIKVGLSYVVGHVVSATAVSESQNQEIDINDNFGWSISPGEKALVLNLFGEIKGKIFERGVTTFPDINSEVHVITSEDLYKIFSPQKMSAPLVFGELTGGIDLPAIIDLQNLVMRHGAIVGATGTGKSNAVATILKGLVSSKWIGSKTIIMDLHGEYSSIVKEKTKVISTIGNGSLVLPFWLLPFSELIAFIVGRQISSEDVGVRNFKEAILNSKIEWLKKKGLTSLIDIITIDSPIPYDLRKIWQDFYIEEYATYTTTDRNVIAWQVNEETSKGDYRKLQIPMFLSAGPGGKQPFKRTGQSMGTASFLDKLRACCLDKNYSFIFGTNENNFLEVSLEELVKSWIGSENITILDLNSVPSDIVDITIGTISRIFFDLWRWGRNEKGVGKQRPLYLIFDEAHLYLSDTKNSFSSGSSIRNVSRILREGRKYGVGALVVSQRPSDINSTIFSQIGTIISLRLNNQSDLGIIKGSMSDNLSGISDLIPSLRTGEALISGEASPLPIRARFYEVEHREEGSDAKIVGNWDKEQELSGIEQAIKKWRSQGN